LARTFALQTEALSKLQGRKTSRQKITARCERYEHQHVHMYRGKDENGGQPYAVGSHAPVTSLLSNDATAPAIPLASRERKARVPNARR
jgi:hypothetical protein